MDRLHELAAKAAAFAGTEALAKAVAALPAI
jgi:hypothetical protein